MKAIANNFLEFGGSFPVKYWKINAIACQLPLLLRTSDSKKPF
ncbi:MAG TPA: hypothetical protein V6D50_20110 [Chroococcales cyanobacterium]